jgi:hypothetical protein
MNGDELENTEKEVVEALSWHLPDFQSFDRLMVRATHSVVKQTTDLAFCRKMLG